jgi:uncharacterized protein YdcH (DUF465 family)
LADKFKGIANDATENRQLIIVNKQQLEGAEQAFNRLDADHKQLDTRVKNIHNGCERLEGRVGQWE